MAFDLSEVTSTEDFDELIPLLWEAYAHPRISYLWLAFGLDRDDDLAKGMAASKEEYIDIFRSDPTGRWLKVTDRASGRIVGGSRWHIHELNPYENQPKVELNMTVWPEGSRRAFANQVFARIRDLRLERYKDVGGFMGPHMMFVHPSYRRQGVGELMLRWGNDRADRLRLQSFVESSPYGVPFYESAGYRVVATEEPGDRTEKPDEDWLYMRRAFDLQPMTWMWRPVDGVFHKGKTVLPPFATENEAVKES